MLTSSLLFLGYCLGSFITMLAYRYPQMLLARGRAAKQLTLFYPRSHCPHCQHPLRWHDNIPLLSYLWLRGRCANCQATIGCCYWLTEAVTLGITLLLLYQNPPLPLAELVGKLLFSWTLVALAVIDWRSGLLPDRLTLGLLWLGLLFQVITQQIPLDQAVLGAVVGYTLLWVLFQAHYRLTGRRGMGYGDFKLTGALGAWVGWQGLFTVLWLASLLALLAFISYMGWRRFTNRHAQRPLGQLRLPFGPYLALAGWWVLMQYPLPLADLLSPSIIHPL
jgi:prepilin signal peptidase PulO-like enzyme (type II secretory pathway)